MILSRIFLSAEHIYFGHHGRPPGTSPVREVVRARIRAGHGLDGDRFAREPAGHKGQVTFFREEAWRELQDKLGRPDRGPEVFRRNLLVRGADLNALIGEEFELQGIRFRGSEYCKPCYWMDRAFASGALELLTSWRAGGLRARVLSDGWVQAESPSAAAETESGEAAALERAPG